MMHQDKQFDPLVIVEEEVIKRDDVVHLHNYYQFIFIRSGTGMHYLNGEKTEFNPGNLFFISPADKHAFEINSTSVMISVRFTAYGKGKIKSLQKAWKGEFAGLKKGRSPLNIKVTFSEKDLPLISAIFDLLNILKKDLLSNEALIYLQIVSLVSIIERNLTYGANSVKTLKTTNPKQTTDLLYTYIHRHISRPEMLTAAKIAAHHGLSEHYIGVYFKKATGTVLKDYINECRQTIIGRKILSLQFSVGQLTAEFNFTDESHFNKSFKKYWGVSPSKYRELHKSPSSEQEGLDRL